MSKIKYNVKGVERGAGGNYEQPKPGLYSMEIVEANLRDADGKNDIEVVLEVTKDNDSFVGSRVWTYIGLGDASQWKLAELTDALGMPETGTLDTEKMKGKILKVKINSDSYNNEYRARVGRLAPNEAEGDEATAEDDPDANTDPDAGDGSFITVERNGVEISTDPSYYDDWSDDDAIEEIENQGLELGRKKKTKANVIAALIAVIEEEAGGSGGGDGNDPDATDASEPEDGDNYDDTEAWSDKEIAAEFKKRGLSVEGKNNRAKAIEALRADDANDDPFGED